MEEVKQKNNKYLEYKEKAKDLSIQLSESRKQIESLKRDLSSQNQSILKNDILLSKGVKVKLTGKQYWITITTYLVLLVSIWYQITRDTPKKDNQETRK